MTTSVGQSNNNTNSYYFNWDRPSSGRDNGRKGELKGEAVIPINPNRRVIIRARGWQENNTSLSDMPVQERTWAESHGGIIEIHRETQQYERGRTTGYGAIYFQDEKALAGSLRNRLTVGAGYLGNRYFDDLAIYGNLCDINSVIYGAADDFAFTLFRTGAITCDQLFRAEGMGLSTDPENLDYGMSENNWDNYALTYKTRFIAMLPHSLEASSIISVSNEGFNPRLYFFLQKRDTIGATTSITTPLGSWGTLGLYDSIGHCRGAEEGTTLSNRLGLQATIGRASFAAEMTSSLSENQLNHYAARLSYGIGPISLAWTGNMEEISGTGGVGSGKKINYGSTFGISASFGGKKNKENELPRVGDDMDIPVSGNITTTDAAKMLNTPRKIGNFSRFYFSYPVEEVESWESLYASHGYGLSTWYRSLQKMLDDRLGVCADQSFFQASLLRANGYDDSFTMHYCKPGQEFGHVITLFKSNGFYHTIEYGTTRKLVTENPVVDATDAAKKVLTARGEPDTRYLMLCQPGVGAINEDITAYDTPIVSESGELHLPHDGAKLIPETGAKVTGADGFLEF